MFKKVYFIVFLLCISVFRVDAQEIRATVNILSPNIQMTNKEVFTTLETAIRDFVNAYQWSSLKLEDNERIDASFIMTINSYQNNTFSGIIQVQYSRPIFNSGYNSPVLSYVDNDLRFNYIINQPLEYQANNHLSNLTSILAFYCNMIIGLDRETMQRGAGAPYFKQMQTIVSNAQNDAAATGWRSFDGQKSRYWLMDNITSPAFEPLLLCLYSYHRLGLDEMYDTDKHLAAKTTIRDALISLQAVFQKRPNALLLNTFFDAKSNEIVSIFSDGPELDIRNLVTVLKQVDAGRTNKYDALGK